MTNAPNPALDRDAFEILVARHRPELQLHCYRMLGSVADAEDAVQDALLGAWKGRAGFEGRSSFRAWLYRITTNACLKVIARRRSVRRILPSSAGTPHAFAPLGQPDEETAWLEPYPDAALEAIPDLSPGPESRYEASEAIQLAFVAAIQALPPRQRAIVLLRDVLGFSALEAAAVLGTTPAATNSGLQRARASLAKRHPRDEVAVRPAPPESQRLLLDRYVRAWEAADVDAFVGLLRDDAVWSMPPWPQWYVGRDPIAAFMSWVWQGGRRRRCRLVRTAANGQPAFADYRAGPEDRAWRPFGIQVLLLRDDAIASVTTFVRPGLFAAFGLPPMIPLARSTQDE